MRLVLSFLLAFTTLSIFAQSDTIRWHNKAILPSFGRIDHGSFSIDSNYYIIGGVDSEANFYSQVWRYNIPSDTWQRMRNFPGGPITEPASFCINGYGYICCGIDSVNNYNNDNEFWKYYPAVDTWEHKVNYPGAGREIPISFVYRQYAFVGFGLGVGVNDFWRYDSNADSWNSISFISIGNRLECGVSVIDSFAYILAGFFDQTAYNDIWRYNINQDHWDSIGLIRGYGRSNPLFWSFDSTILFGYGEEEDSNGNGLFSTDFYSYQPKINKWDTLHCINFPDSIADGQGAGCFQLGKTAYFFGGYKTYVVPTYYNNLWSFDASQFFSRDTVNGIAEVNSQADFSVYPNPIKDGQEFSVATSESGEIFFYDEVGRLLDERKINSGVNQIKINSGNEVIFYKVILQNGITENGKIIAIK